MFISNLVKEVINTGFVCKKKNTWLIIEYDNLLVQEKKGFRDLFYFPLSYPSKVQPYNIKSVNVVFTRHKPLQYSRNLQALLNTPRVL